MGKREWTQKLSSETQLENAEGKDQDTEIAQNLLNDSTNESEGRRLTDSHHDND
jgi:hypothetical protein